ncbi:EF-P beta-lysylation protein EpmB [Methylocucumis oryzae]|uniref:EF-P beta-lysylation protein EpmB n=1 Tax=Methylocucumis oryzae TaxID=1632867 RepID=UPI000A5EC969|nr:EF-P beta-lysylation protein EpmB [Methylocucumis oryzae]
MRENLNHAYSHIDTDNQHLQQSWQQQLQSAFSNVQDLCDYLELAITDLPFSLSAQQQFAFKVPLSFAACMEKGNANDPLLRQVLPIVDETKTIPGFSLDPVGDLAAKAVTGVIHKYQGRALLINTGSCAINCRYCFRRHFPYSDWQLSKLQEQQALDYLSSDPNLHEVILSGGDPLLLNDARLSTLLTKLATLPQLKRIRLHSRLPIVLPARITESLLTSLKHSGKTTTLVVHCNHANELNPRVFNACQQLRQHGIHLLNQSVLLKGVNDNVQDLAQLSERLFDFGIQPYYLHILDKTAGTAHFDVNESDALALMQALKTLLPGYLVPKLVKEVAGDKAKQVLA